MIGERAPSRLEPALLSYPAAGEYLCAPPETVRSWVKQGLFRRVRIGHRSFVLKADLDAYISKQLEDDD